MNWLKYMKIFKVYKENNEYLDGLEVTKKDRTKSFIYGYLISLIITASPIIICAHFFIYSFYFSVVLAMLFLLILTFAILGEILSDKFLLHFSKADKIKDLKVTYILHAILYFVMTFIGYLIIIFLN